MASLPRPIQPTYNLKQCYVTLSLHLLWRKLRVSNQLVLMPKVDITHLSVLDTQKKGFGLVLELYAQSVSLLAMKYVPDAHPRHDLHLCRELTAGRISCLQLGAFEMPLRCTDSTLVPPGGTVLWVHHVCLSPFTAQLQIQAKDNFATVNFSSILTWQCRHNLWW